MKTQVNEKDRLLLYFVRSFNFGLLEYRTVYFMNLNLYFFCLENSNTWL